MSRNQQNKNPKKKGKFGANLVIVVFIILGVIGLTLPNIGASEKYPDMNYKDFTKHLEDGQVLEVDINFEETQFLATIKSEIEVEGKDEKQTKFVVANPYKEDFKETLLLADVDIHETKTPVKSGGSGFGSIIIFILISVVLFILVTKLMSKGAKSQANMINSKTKAKFTSEMPKKSFADIAGYKEQKKDLQTIVHFMKESKEYEAIGAKLPKGAILAGPPGTGKTLLAKAVANEANVPFFAISGSDFVEMFVGVGAARVRDLWAEARKHPKSIIFIDEIDAIGKKRGQGFSGGNDEREQTLNQILVEMDGVGSENSKSHVFVIAATNRIDTLDDALVRPGRFDKHIYVGLPDKKERFEIINLYKKSKKFIKDIDFTSIAKKTFGFSGAKLEALMNEAAIIAVQNGSKEIKESHIDDAFYKVVTGGNKKAKEDRDTTEDDMRLIAWHEAGHGLTSKLLTTDKLVELNIVASTSGAGGMLISYPEKEGLHSRDYFLKRIMVTYAGRAAEEILLGDPNLVTTGASSDIQQATNRLLAFVKQYGFSEQYGMLDLTNEHLSKINVEEEVKELSKKLYDDTLEFLKANKDKLQVLAEALMEREVLSESEIDILLDGGTLPPDNDDFNQEENVEDVKETKGINDKTLQPSVSFIENK